MSNDELRAARVAVAAANPSLTMAEVDQRAQDILRYEADLAFEAEVEAIAAEALAERHRAGDRLMAVALGEEVEDGPTIDQILGGLEELQADGKGWR